MVMMGAVSGYGSGYGGCHVSGYGGCSGEEGVSRVFTPTLVLTLTHSLTHSLHLMCTIY